MPLTVLPCTAEHIERAIQSRIPKQWLYDHFVLYKNNISFQMFHYCVFVSNPCGWDLVDQLIATVPEQPYRVYYWSGLRVPDHIRALM